MWHNQLIRVLYIFDQEFIMWALPHYNFFDNKILIWRRLYYIVQYVSDRYNQSSSIAGTVLRGFIFPNSSLFLWAPVKFKVEHESNSAYQCVMIVWALKFFYCYIHASPIDIFNYYKWKCLIKVACQMCWILKHSKYPNKAVTMK